MILYDVGVVQPSYLSLCHRDFLLMPRAVLSADDLTCRLAVATSVLSGGLKLKKQSKCRARKQR